LAEPAYTHAYVSTIEAGRREPSSQALEYFAKKLGVSNDELATGRPADLSTRLELELQEARRNVSSGLIETADETFSKLGGQAKRYKLSRLQALALRGKALCAEQRGELEAAFNLYEESERVVAREPVTERVEAVVGKARCARLQGDLRYAVYLVEQTLDELERRGLRDPNALLRLHASVVPPYFQLGARKEAARSAQQALNLSAGASDPERLADMHMNVARVFLSEGRVEDAQASLGQAESFYRQLGFQTEIAQCHLAKGFILGREGAAGEAREELEQARGMFVGLGSRIEEARVSAELARLERVEGRVERAGTLLARALDVLSEESDVPLLGWVHRELALCALPDDRQTAEKEFRTAIELFRRTEEKLDLATTYRMLGDLLHDTGNRSGSCLAYRNGLLAIE
jgi:tetratricopeptide (TPR) repeat protein